MIPHDKILLQTSSCSLANTKLIIPLPVLLWFILLQQFTDINLCIRANTICLELEQSFSCSFRIV